MVLKGVIKLEDGKVTAVHNLTYGFDPAQLALGSLHAALTTLSAEGWKVEGNIDEATGQGKHELPMRKDIQDFHSESTMLRRSPDQRIGLKVLAQEWHCNAN